MSPGNLIGPDTGVLVNVVQEDPMEVLFSVSQREMLEARRGTDSPATLLARIKLADGSIYPETGHLDFVDVQANPQITRRCAAAGRAAPPAGCGCCSAGKAWCRPRRPNIACCA